MAEFIRNSCRGSWLKSCWVLQLLPFCSEIKLKNTIEGKRPCHECTGTETRVWKKNQTSTVNYCAPRSSPITRCDLVLLSLQIPIGKQISKLHAWLHKEEGFWVNHKAQSRALIPFSTQKQTKKWCHRIYVELGIVWISNLRLTHWEMQPQILALNRKEKIHLSSQIFLQRTQKLNDSKSYSL